MGVTLTWHHLCLFVRNLPRDSALVRAILGDDYHWDLTNQLLAVLADAAHVANWQRSGGARRNRPDPIPRPGVEKPKAFGGEPVSIEEMRERLDRRRHLATVED